MKASVQPGVSEHRVPCADAPGGATIVVMVVDADVIRRSAAGDETAPPQGPAGVTLPLSPRVEMRHATYSTQRCHGHGFTAWLDTE